MKISFSSDICKAIVSGEPHGSMKLSNMEAWGDIQTIVIDMDKALTLFRVFLLSISSNTRELSDIVVP